MYRLIMARFFRCPGPTIRRGQIITTFGPGAIVNFENGSFIGMSIDAWPPPAHGKSDVIYDERLLARLHLSHFRQPPSQDQIPKGLPYRRFPRWLRCPNPGCWSLNKVDELLKKDTRNFRDEAFACRGCGNKKMIPVPIVVACRKGHIDDFPWMEWVHKGREICAGAPDIKYSRSGGGVGLGGFMIECNKCSRRESMKGAFSPSAFDGLKIRCSGSRPWSKDPSPLSCGEVLMSVQRGGSNVYFPKIVSSITIPPYSDSFLEKIQQSQIWQFLTSATFDAGFSAPSKELEEQLIKRLAQESGESESSISDAVKRYLHEPVAEKDEDRTEDGYRYSEYQAFHGNYDKLRSNRKNFDLEEIATSKELQSLGIKKIVLVRALREVRALLGFSRLRPLDQDDLEPGGQDKQDETTMVSVADNAKSCRWRPAVEVRGEGIFLTLDNEKVARWQANEKVLERCRMLNLSWKKSCEKRKITFQTLTPSFLLVHSMSHLLIRQLGYESGYSSASLRERIYCEKHAVDGKMTGFLIYTAAGDADGTLGGLVRQARPDRFIKTFSNATEAARWCSNDPLCSESRGQGYESLNLAACYACSLLSETSCEEYNKFLDRALVVGLPNDPSVGYVNA